MAQDRQLGIYLDDPLRSKVAEGGHNFFRQLLRAFKERDFGVALYPNDPVERIKSADRPGYSLFHLETPTHDRALDVRLAYMYPFWRFERAQWREDYRVAGLEFRPKDVDGDAANRFFRLWRRRMKKTRAWQPLEQRDFVFIPLQGRLLEMRHGQSATPVEMISAALTHDRFRKIIVKLHPGETYSPEELAALEPFQSNPRIAFSTAPAHALLENCEYVVTQNSTVAFEGLFHRKPAILFGRSDFHHMCQNVHDVGAELAFRNILATQNPYARYVYWFLQENAINAAKPDTGSRIIETCQGFGWDI